MTTKKLTAAKLVGRPSEERRPVEEHATFADVLEEKFSAWWSGSGQGSEAWLLVWKLLASGSTDWAALWLEMAWQVEWPERKTIYEWSNRKRTLLVWSGSNRAEFECDCSGQVLSRAGRTEFAFQTLVLSTLNSEKAEYWCQTCLSSGWSSFRRFWAFWLRQWWSGSGSLCCPGSACNKINRLLRNVKPHLWKYTKMT